MIILWSGHIDWIPLAVGLLPVDVPGPPVVEVRLQVLPAGQGIRELLCHRHNTCLTEFIYRLNNLNIVVWEMYGIWGIFAAAAQLSCCGSCRLKTNPRMLVKYKHIFLKFSTKQSGLNMTSQYPFQKVLFFLTITLLKSILFLRRSKHNYHLAKRTFKL